METMAFIPANALFTTEVERFEFRIPDNGDEQWNFMEELHRLLTFLGVEYNNVQMDGDRLIVVATRKKG
jgi:hypothetical protein